MATSVDAQLLNKLLMTHKPMRINWQGTHVAPRTHFSFAQALHGFVRLLTETFEPEWTTSETRFCNSDNTTAVVEVGPRMSFTTAWSANAVSICHSCGLTKVTRIEKSQRYQLRSDQPVSQQQQLAFAAMVSPTEQIVCQSTGIMLMQLCLVLQIATNQS